MPSISFTRSHMYNSLPSALLHVSSLWAFLHEDSKEWEWSFYALMIGCQVVAILLETNCTKSSIFTLIG